MNNHCSPVTSRSCLPHRPRCYFFSPFTNRYLQSCVRESQAHKRVRTDVTPLLVRGHSPPRSYSILNIYTRRAAVADACVSATEGNAVVTEPKEVADAVTSMDDDRSVHMPRKRSVGVTSWQWPEAATDRPATTHRCRRKLSHQSECYQRAVTPQLKLRVAQERSEKVRKIKNTLESYAKMRATQEERKRDKARVFDIAQVVQWISWKAKANKYRS